MPDRNRFLGFRSANQRGTSAIGISMQSSRRDFILCKLSDLGGQFATKMWLKPLSSAASLADDRPNEPGAGRVQVSYGRWSSPCRDENLPASSRKPSDATTAEIIVTGVPNPTTESGRTAIAATAMPANQITATRSGPRSMILRVPIVVSVIVGMLKPISGCLEIFHFLHQRTYRHVDADTPRAGRGLYR